MQIGYHASHEQHAPGRLLEYVTLAEKAGFDGAMCSDHLAPFTAGGNSGFAWSWLGAALERTNLSFGVVTCTGYRYHPAVTAQAAATLADMYPGRFWMALGSGEWLNEHVADVRWPPKAARKGVLRQAGCVVRQLMAGETVSGDELLPIHEARLYVRPAQPPPIFAAAITPATAREVASWADGLITVGGPGERMREVLSAFREGGGEGKPVLLQAQHSFARSDEEARRAAVENWRVAALTSEQLADLATPEEMDQAAANAEPAQILRNVRASADPKRHLEWLLEYRDLGFDVAYIHNVQKDDEPFIEAFGSEVLPAVKQAN